MVLFPLPCGPQRARAARATAAHPTDGCVLAPIARHFAPRPGSFTRQTYLFSGHRPLGPACKTDETVTDAQGAMLSGLAGKVEEAVGVVSKLQSDVAGERTSSFDQLQQWQTQRSEALQQQASAFLIWQSLS